MNNRVYSFIGGEEGPWCIVSIRSIIGETLANAERLNVHSGAKARSIEGADAAAALRASEEWRYVECEVDVRLERYSA